MSETPDIIYDDAEIVVVNKPARMFVHPAPGHETGTLSDALVRRFPAMADVGSRERPGVVHRLDSDTSGVMVFAKTRRAYLALRKQFEAHTEVRKTYLAVTSGAPKTKSGTLDTLIGRKPWDAKRMAVDVPDGKRAVTHWEVLARRNCRALVEFRIETGRTHQIRVHAEHLGCPIIGDPLYGNNPPRGNERGNDGGNKRGNVAGKERGNSRTLLHAVELSFIHPATGKRVTFAAPPPSDILFPR